MMSFTGPSAATLTQIAATTVSTVAFSAGTNIYGRNIYNASTVRIYVTYGTVASRTNITFTIAANTNGPFAVPTYTGPVSILFDNPDAAGTAYTSQW